MTVCTSYQPALGLQRAIATDGYFPSRGDQNGGTEATLGMIHTFAYGFQAGGVAAQGQLLAIQSNSALFMVLGTQYGGDGVTKFALPDLAGRISVMTSSDASRSASKPATIPSRSTGRRWPRSPITGRPRSPTPSRI